MQNYKESTRIKAYYFILLFCFLICESHTLFAQRMRSNFSNDPVVSHRFHSSRDYGLFEIDQQIIWVTYLQLFKEISLNFLNDDISKKEHYLFSLESPILDYLGIFQLGAKKIYLIYSKKNGEKISIAAKEIDYNDKKMGDEEILFDIPASKNKKLIRNLNKYLTVKSSPDKSKLSIIFREEGTQLPPKDQYLIYCFENELTNYWSTDFEFPYTSEDMSIPEFFQTNENIIATYINKATDKSKGFDAYGYVKVNKHGYSDHGDRLLPGYGIVDFVQTNSDEIAFVQIESADYSRKLFQKFSLIILDVENSTQPIFVEHEFDPRLFFEPEIGIYGSINKITHSLINKKENKPGIYGIQLSSVFKNELGNYFVVFEQYNPLSSDLFSKKITRMQARNTVVACISPQLEVTAVHKIAKSFNLYKDIGAKGFLYQNDLYLFFPDALENKDILTSSASIPQKELNFSKPFTLACAIVHADSSDISKKIVREFSREDRFIPSIPSMREIRPGKYLIETQSREEIYNYPVYIRPVNIQIY